MYTVYSPSQATFLRAIDDGHHNRMRPLGVAVSGDELFIADLFLRALCVHRISDGSFVDVCGRVAGMSCDVAICGDDLFVVVDGYAEMLLVFRISDRAWVRDIGADQLRNPHRVAAHGGLGVVLVTDDRPQKVSVYRVGDGTLARYIETPNIMQPRGIAVHGDLVLVSGPDAGISMFRIADGAFVRHIDGSNAVVSISAYYLAVHDDDDVVIANENKDTVSAYRIADGTLAYRVEMSRIAPRGLAVRRSADGASTLLVADLGAHDVCEYRLPAVVRWRPDVDVHAQFGAAFRDIAQAVLAAATRRQTCGLSRLPLELMCAVLNELTHV